MKHEDEPVVAEQWWCCDADYPNHALTCKNASNSQGGGEPELPLVECAICKQKVNRYRPVCDPCARTPAPSQAAGEPNDATLRKRFQSALNQITWNTDERKSVAIARIALNCDDAATLSSTREPSEQVKQRARAWQPIETAPRDGTPVLLWWPYWYNRTPIWGYYDDVLQQWFAWQALSPTDDGPTHWMPLPEPPTTDVEQGER